MKLTKVIFLLAILSCTSAYIIAQENESQENETWQEFNLNPPNDENATNPYDPWEPFNRGVFRVSRTIDNHTLRPLAQGYYDITPNPIVTGISNFFDNIGELSNAINGILQLNTKIASYSFFRLLINSTIGIFGFFDAASYFKIEHSPTSYSETLHKYGVPYGPFIMYGIIPGDILTLVDYSILWFISPYTVTLNFLYFPYLNEYTLELFIIWTINTRAEFLELEEFIFGDEYQFIRDSYLQRRSFLANDGQVEEDPFSDEF